jgi:hypothetical protein
MAVALNILVIDDDKVDLITIIPVDFTIWYLSRCGKRFSAKNGIEKIKAFNYDLIF